MIDPNDIREGPMKRFRVLLLRSEKAQKDYTISRDVGGEYQWIKRELAEEWFSFLENNTMGEFEVTTQLIQTFPRPIEGEKRR